MNGLRLGTPEIVRRGVTPEHAPELAGFVARALNATTDLRSLGEEVTRWRAGFTGMHFLAG